MHGLSPRGGSAGPVTRGLAACLVSGALLVGLAPATGAATPLDATPAANVNSVHATITKVTTSAGFAPVGAVVVGPVAPDETLPIEADDGIGPKRGYWLTGGMLAPSSPAALAIPRVAATQVSTRSDATGGNGISGTEMRYASPDGERWNYSIEPPDMGLCVGNGYVVQAVNGAVQISDTQGHALTGVTPANYFIGWPSEYPDGPGVGDPRCQYDAATHRFFMTWYINGGMSVLFGTLLAVSNSSNPLGSWTVYEVPDGGGGLDTPFQMLDGCQVACFPDYPQLGMDANAVWLTTNEFDFGQDPPPYAGVVVWGISKHDLVHGDASVGAWVWGLGYSGDTYVSEPIAFTVQPANNPAGAYDRSSDGTQYLLSTRDMSGTIDNQLDVWAVTNTSAIASGHGTPRLRHLQLTSQTYACDCLAGAPAGGATQKAGDYPLGQGGYPAGGIEPGQALARLSTNDDRMHQVTYADGMLWGAASTVMRVTGSSSPTTGIAWWTIDVGTRNGSLSAHINGQGYIGARNTYLWFPAVTVSGGRGYVAMTLSGPGYYPSVAYATFGPRTGASTVRIAGSGVAPADGFSAYDPNTRDGTERWGDYSAAATDERGRVWFSAEYVSKDSRVPDRALLLNWGTYIGSIRP